MLAIRRTTTRTAPTPRRGRSTGLSPVAPRPLSSSEAQRLLNHTVVDRPTARKALQAAVDASGRSAITVNGKLIGDRASKASCVRLAAWAQDRGTLV